MDAVEYEKYRIKMCKEMVLQKGGCSACEMYDVLRQRCRTPASVCMEEDEDYYKKNVSIVEQWAKDHPVKTRKSEFLKMLPNAQMVNIASTFCVAHFDSTKACKESNPSDEKCIACRYRFWNEEVTP